MDWEANKKAQKDTDARWTKKHGKSIFGYKSYIQIDRDLCAITLQPTQDLRQTQRRSDAQDSQVRTRPTVQTNKGQLTCFLMTKAESIRDDYLSGR